MRIRRLLFWLILIFIFFYVTGLLSPPEIEYIIFIKMQTEEMYLKDITVYLPFPYYRILSLPYYKGRPINKIYEVLNIASSVRNIKLRLIKTRSYGYMLEVNIPRLSCYDKKIPTNELNLRFKDVNIGYFITPSYLFKDIGSIFFLNPSKERWQWVKEDKRFLAKNDVKTFVYTNSCAKRVDVEVTFKVKKRIILREVILTKKFKDRHDIKKDNWHQVEVEKIYRKRWLP